MNPNDLEVWKTFFIKYNVSFEVKDYYKEIITLKTGEGDGDGNCSMHVEFDKQGKFLSYGVWG